VSARRARQEVGSITLWLLGLAVMLVPVGGLALDLGRAFSERRAVASAADAAALAGASALDEARYRLDGTVRLDPVAAANRARRSLEEQGDRSPRPVRIDVATDAVTVEVEGHVDLTLLRLVGGGDPFVVRATATARAHLRE
jgi:Flp pilus assembly protein TadG